MRLMSIAVGLLFSMSAVAGAGWSGPRTILGLEVSSVGVEIRLAGSGVGCTAMNEGGVQKTWTKIDVGQANEKQLIAVLLTAYATGKEISVHCASATDWTSLDRIIASP
jgi:hypothetical protein